MQIVVVDDCSTRDDPEAVVARIGGGRVDFYRQTRNRGHVRNFDTCLQKSRGHLVHLLHGDDEVRPGFYERMERIFARFPTIGAAFCRHEFVDPDGNHLWFSPVERAEDGVLPNWLPVIGGEQRIQAPSMVVRREVYERLGSFDRRLRSMGEDWEMWVRIAAHYPVGYVPEPLAVYRLQRASSLSSAAARTAADTRDMHTAINLAHAHLATVISPAAANRIVAPMRRTFSSRALRVGRRLLREGEFTGARAQVRAAIACHGSPATFWAGGLLYVRSWIRAARVRLTGVGTRAGPRSGAGPA